MQIQQLRYLIAVAESGSFRQAATKLYVAQSSISVAIRDLERETGVTVFDRTARGTTLTAEGAELVGYARSVVDQMDLMEERYSRDGRTTRDRLAISSQHYSLVVDAFGDFLAAHPSGACEFSLRESHTDQIIRDVQELRSDLGVIYLGDYNDRVIGRALGQAGLSFTSLYIAVPHAIVGGAHPLAGRTSVTVDDLAPYCRFEQEQGTEASSFFAEEPLASAPSKRRVVLSDNGTLSTLLGMTDGYALGTGAFRSEGDISAVPIDTAETMNVGYICRNDVQESEFAREFLQLLAQRILRFPGPIQISPDTHQLACE